MLADVQVAVAENLHARRAAKGIMIKHNQTAITSAQAAVGDQRGIARGRGLEEPREAAACPAGRAAVVDKCAIARGRGVAVEFREAGAEAEAPGTATVVGEGAIACGRGVREPREAAF